MIRKSFLLKKVSGRNCSIICDQLIDDLIFGYDFCLCELFGNLDDNDNDKNIEIMIKI